MSCFLCHFSWLHSYCQQIGMCWNLWNHDANCSEHMKQHISSTAAGWCRQSASLWWRMLIWNTLAFLKLSALFSALLKNVVFNSNLDPVSFLTSYHMVHILSCQLCGDLKVCPPLDVLIIIWTLPSAFQSVVVAMWHYICQHRQHWSSPFPLVWILPCREIHHSKCKYPCCSSVIDV